VQRRRRARRRPHPLLAGAMYLTPSSGRRAMLSRRQRP
jgi:hypothetical protein